MPMDNYFRRAPIYKSGSWRNQERCHCAIAIAISVESTLYFCLFLTLILMSRPYTLTEY